MVVFVLVVMASTTITSFHSLSFGAAFMCPRATSTPQPSKKSEPMTAQARFLKETQDAFKMYHKYPSESFMIYPPDGSMGDAAMDGAENEDDGSTR